MQQLWTSKLDYGLRLIIITSMLLGTIGTSTSLAASDFTPRREQGVSQEVTPIATEPKISNTEAIPPAETTTPDVTGTPTPKQIQTTPTLDDLPITEIPTSVVGSVTPEPTVTLTRTVTPQPTITPTQLPTTTIPITNLVPSDLPIISAVLNPIDQSEKVTLPANGGAALFLGGRVMVMANQGTFPGGAILTLSNGQVITQTEPAPTVIPAEAITPSNQVELTEPVTRTVVPIPGLGDPSQAEIRFTIEAQDAISQDPINMFNGPVLLVFDLRDLEGTKPNQNRFIAYRDSGDSSIWHRMDIVEHTNDGLISTLTDHFTDWGAGNEPGAWHFKWNAPVVSEFSGAASYRYPIAVPAGRNGLTPNIDVSYSSRGLDAMILSNRDQGPLGLGWGFNNIEISRKNVHLIGDGAHYRLVHPDAYQIVINGAGHDIFTPDNTANSVTSYFAHNDPSLRIQRYSGAGAGDMYWIVTTGDGTRYRLGATVDSENRQFQGYGLVLVTRGGVETGVDSSGMRWRVDTITDVFGNQIQYDYREWSTRDDYPNSYSETDQSRLLEIRYDYASLMPAGAITRLSSSYASKITFIGNGDNKRVSQVRLYHIDLLSPYRVVDFGLSSITYNDGCGQSQTTEKVTTIREYDNTGTTTLPATTFNYSTYGHSGANCYKYDYVAEVQNGYGSSVQFTYQSDGRVADTFGPGIPEYGHSYFVTQQRTYDGINASPAIVDFAYQTPCYDGIGAYPLGLMTGAFDCPSGDVTRGGPLVGFNRTTITAKDYDGSTVLSRSVTNFYQDLNKQGRPFLSQQLNITSFITANNVGMESTTDWYEFGNVNYITSNFVTTEAQSGKKSLNFNVTDFSQDSGMGNNLSGWVASQNYWMGIWVKSPNANQTICLRVWPGVGGEISVGGGSGCFPVTTNWQLIQGAVTLPANATAFQVRVRPGLNSTGNFYVDDFYANPVMLSTETYYQALGIANVTSFTYASNVRTTTHDGNNSKKQQTDYEYDTKGNLQKTIEYGYDASGGSYGQKRAIFIYFNPNTTDWIVNKPAKAEAYECVNNTCTDTTWILKSSTVSLYETATASQWNTPPARPARLTTIRKWKNDSPTEYLDTSYTYDNFGNLKSEKTYTGYGSATAVASTVRATTTANYDGWGLYLLNVTTPPNASGTSLTTNFEYYGINGVAADGQLIGTVKRTIDPNSVEAGRYFYDSFGRLNKVIRPDDNDTYPTTSYAYSDLANPVLAAPFLTVGNPGFETGADWFTWTSPPFAFSYDTVEKHSGSRSLKIVSSSSAGWVGSTNISNWASYRGQKVFLSAWVKAPTATQFCLRVVPKVGNPELEVNCTTATNSWKLVQGSVYLPSNTADMDTFLLLLYLITPNATLYVDDVQVSAGITTPTPEALPLRVQTIQRETSNCSGCVLPVVEFYDGLGRPIQTRAEVTNGGTQSVTNIVYDALGREKNRYVPVSETFNWWFSRPTGWNTQPKSTTTYEALGRVSIMTAPDGTNTYHYYYLDNDTTLNYTPTGLWNHAVKDANNFSRHEITDAWGRTIKVREFTGTAYGGGSNCTGNYYCKYSETQYGYDTLDQLTDVWDDAGKNTHINYNALGRKLNMSDPDMGYWVYDYDTVGNLVKQTDARNQTLCFTYDLLNRLRFKHRLTLGVSDCINGTKTQLANFEYDDMTSPNKGRGRRTLMVDATGTTEWMYDNRGRVTQEERTLTATGLNLTFITGYAYDAMDRVTAITYPSGEVVNQTYNPQGLLENVRSTDFSQQWYTNNLDYDVAGRLTTLIFGNTVLTTNYSYYAWTSQGGRLQSIQTGSLQNLSYTYDAVGNILTLTDGANSNQQQTFGYDHLHRLTSATTNAAGNGQYNQSFAYSTIGNITSATSTLNAPNLGTYVYGATATGCSTTQGVKPHAASATTGNSYQYDCNGNMTQRTEILVGVTTAYTQQFDAENHLISVTNTTANPDQVTTFYYDGDGARVLQVKPDGSKLIYLGNLMEVEIAAGGGGPTPTPTNTPAGPTPTPTNTPTGGSGAFQESGGLVVMQAENEDGNITRSGDTWNTVTNWAGYTGSGFIRTEPDDGNTVTTNIPTTAAETNYQINFGTTGAYKVWMRVYGPNGSGDSAHVGLDGQTVAATTDWSWGSANNGQWAWVGGGSREIVVSSTGIHTLNVWMREDGGGVDCIVLTTSSAYTPPTGTCPTESSRGGGGPTPTPTSTNTPTPTPTPSGQQSFQESGGQVVMQAENEDGNITRGGDTWNTVTNWAGYTGAGFMRTEPDDGNTVTTNIPTSAAEMNYRINFSTTGTYKVWARVYGPNASGDSFHVGLNGATVAATTDWSWGSANNGQWVWSGGGSREIVVSTTGIHTLNVWMREDGGGVDCIVLTTSSSYTPPTGTCPTESARAIGGAGKVLARPKLSDYYREHERFMAALNTQPSGHIWRTYYLANGKSIALRVYSSNGANNILYFMHQDHLGSTSLTTTSNGALVSREYYYPYGESRPGGTGTTPTTIGYTGQRRDTGLGSLMFYNARYYSPLLSRFVSADTLIPEPGNPQTMNRFSYVYNNPISYVDPTGHCGFKFDTEGNETLDGYDCTLKDFDGWDISTRLKWIRLFMKDSGSGRWFANIEGVLEFMRDSGIDSSSWAARVDAYILHAIQDGYALFTGAIKVSSNPAAQAWVKFHQERRSKTQNDSKLRQLWGAAEQLATDYGVAMVGWGGHTAEDLAIAKITNLYRGCLIAGTCSDFGRILGTGLGLMGAHRALCVQGQACADGRGDINGAAFGYWFSDPRSKWNGHSPVYWAAKFMFGRLDSGTATKPRP